MAARRSPPPVGLLSGGVPSINHRGDTPHITAISLRMNFLGGAPLPLHHRETVSRLTSNFSMSWLCFTWPYAMDICIRHGSVSGGTRS